MYGKAGSTDAWHANCVPLKNLVVTSVHICSQTLLGMWIMNLRSIFNVSLFAWYHLCFFYFIRGLYKSSLGNQHWVFTAGVYVENTPTIGTFKTRTDIRGWSHIFHRKFDPNWRLIPQETCSLLNMLSNLLRSWFFPFFFSFFVFKIFFLHQQYGASNAEKQKWVTIKRHCCQRNASHFIFSYTFSSVAFLCFDFFCEEKEKKILPVNRKYIFPSDQNFVLSKKHDLGNWTCEIAYSLLVFLTNKEQIEKYHFDIQSDGQIWQNRWNLYKYSLVIL